MNNQLDDTMDSLIKTQVLLGDLGFTLTSSNNYYKDYAAVDGSSFRLTPIFDNGLAQDKSWKLVAIDISSYKRIELDPSKPAPLHEFPKECLDDVSTMLIKLAPDVAKIAKRHVHIITAECNKCNLHSESFVHIRGRTLCLSCTGIKI